MSTRGFAGTRGTDDGQGFTAAHTEAHIGENGERTLGARHGLGDVAGFEYELVMNRGILHWERQ
jgi:hypothetical protein